MTNTKDYELICMKLQTIFIFIFCEIMMECTIITKSIADMKHRKYVNIRLVKSRNLSSATYLSAPRCNIIIRFPCFLHKLLNNMEFFFSRDT